MTHRSWIFAAAAGLTSLWLGAGVAPAAESACKKIAGVQHEACKSEAKDDFLTSKASCLNLGDKAEVKECVGDATDDSKETKALCKDQKEARKDLCEELGENRYDPDFDPANFETNFGAPTTPNPYFPLEIGHTWQYQGGDETIEIEIQDKTKLIEGVTCVVVRDVVTVGGLEVEDTDDWFAQRTADGTVVYCGEISQNFEVFPGDDPLEAELVDVEGSWKAGRDGALPGTLFLGTPVVGAVYRQELARGDAEDAAEVLSTTYAFGSDAELDQFVPQALADALCDGDCVVTREFSPLSPDGVERKYYARDVGLFLEVDPDGGDVLALVDCNFAAACDDLD